MTEIDIQVQEAQRVPNKMNPKRTTPRHIIIKMPKVKDKGRILKAAREKRTTKNKDSVSSLCDNFKCSDICIIGVPEGEEKEQETVNLCEKIMTENFPNLVKEIDMQVQEPQRVSNKMHPKRTTPRHIIIKMPKVKDKES